MVTFTCSTSISSQFIGLAFAQTSFALLPARAAQRWMAAHARLLVLTREERMLWHAQFVWAAKRRGRRTVEVDDAPPATTPPARRTFNSSRDGDQAMNIREMCFPIVLAQVCREACSSPFGALGVGQAGLVAGHDDGRLVHLVAHRVARSGNGRPTLLGYHCRTERERHGGDHHQSVLTAAAARPASLTESIKASFGDVFFFY